MAKKRVPISLRKPPSPESVEAFVAREPAEPVVEPAAPDSSARPVDHEARAQDVALDERATVTGPDGTPLRALTVYLPARFADELAIYCASVDRDPSRVVAEALEAHFRRQLGAAPAPTAGHAASSGAQAGEPRASTRRSSAWQRGHDRRRASGAAAVALLDGALRVFELAQTVALKLRVQLQRA